MVMVAQPRNLRAAMKRVKKNRGAPGVDGMRVEELQAAWPTLEGELHRALLDGSYRPQPVRKHEIPKAGGKVRTLGIPTVVDRVVQQAILQALQPLVDPSFSNSSFGFRPGRSAHQALQQGLRHAESGRVWVVDLDLEKFFDRVNHDVLMSRLAKRIEDKGLLRLIRQFLQAGMMDHAIFEMRSQGTPQGGPLSPLLGNILLDEVDKMLEARGHRFVRYADDLTVYVFSERGGKRVLAGLRKKLSHLRLSVNEEKTKIVPVKQSTLLGFRLSGRPGGGLRWVVSQTSLRRFQQLTRRPQGRTGQDVIQRLNRYLRGWHGYFRLAKTPSTYARLDGWIRRRLRAYALATWRTIRRIYGKCIALGSDHDTAKAASWYARKWWRGSRRPIRRVLTPKRFQRWGLYALAG